jgi:hypothetical protein
MPTIPPIVLKMIDEIESIPPPHNSGTKLPMVDPMNNPIQIRDF